MNEVAFLVGQIVTEIRDESRIVFVAGDQPEPALYADVGDFVVTDGANQSTGITDLLGRTVTDASTANDVLSLRFSDGFGLRCEPQPAYEAWQVVGGDPQSLVVCLPGGGLAVWDRRDRPLSLG